MHFPIKNRPRKARKARKIPQHNSIYCFCWAGSQAPAWEPS